MAFGLAKLGQPCGMTDPSNPEHFTFCGESVSCVDFGDGSGVCMADTPLGGACGGAGQPDCQAGLACVTGTCVLKTAVQCGG